MPGIEYSSYGACHILEHYTYDHLHVYVHVHSPFVILRHNALTFVSLMM